MKRVEILSSHLSNNSINTNNTNASKHMTVVGACFMDYVSYVERFPQGGETLHAESFQKGFGGKGANMAVIIGRLGGRVSMVGKVGGDGDGSDYIKNFKNQNVETSKVGIDTNHNTGLAKILVDKSGENLIVISPNATSTVDPTFLQSTNWLEGTDIVVCQNETPLTTNLWALEQASKAGKTTVFVPAPAPSPDQLDKLRPVMKYVSIFAPNQHEASLMLQYPVEGVEAGLRAAVDLRKKLMRPNTCVIITMGSSGSAVLDSSMSEAVHIPASPVPREKVIDTTGAGDCYAGSLCYFISTGSSVIDAVKKATYCAGLSVQKKGTQSSYPNKNDLPKGW
eukprot:TRINITY_DN60_c2_g3_i1.p1 TRINITY_DN60_c2_g3~~TRINITY_DN60_c2_g3_i1.p1  ORF type:complete len:338 (+),score=84.34 TRINITY_DN60_c2_g3_i1:61-1074(+)